MKSNFHTHNYRCNHAVGNAFDYVKKAVEEKYDVIGISDHGPMPDYYQDRMSFDALDDYIEEIRQAQERYSGKIKVYKGLEIEYFDDQHTYYQFLLKKLDYLVLAVHDFKFNDKLVCSFFIKNDQELECYFETMISAIKSGFFRFMAHPDLFGIHYKFTDTARHYTHELAKVCVEHDFILEFNANGFRKGKDHFHSEYRYPYPLEDFWDIIKDYRVKVIVNSDCHDPILLNDSFDQLAMKKARAYGLNIIDTIF